MFGFIYVCIRMWISALRLTTIEWQEVVIFFNIDLEMILSRKLQKQTYVFIIKTNVVQSSCLYMHYSFYVFVVLSWC